jgi:hypothetical protein
MTGFTALWLPILLSAVAIFFVSSFVHMALPWHKSDYQRIPHEDEVMDALRPFAIPPGDYLVPRPTVAAEVRTPEFREKAKKGPVFVATVMPNGMFGVGRQLGGWFVYLLVVSACAAYITGRAVPPGTPYLEVFRFAGATAFIGYSLALWQNSIWYRRKWSTTIKTTIDGLIYGAITAGLFGWLWPR